LFGFSTKITTIRKEQVMSSYLLLL